MNNYKICVVTGSRADYGLLRPLLCRITEDPDFDLRLLVTGTHLCEAFGYTCNEIEEDGFPIDAKLEMILSSDSAAGMVKSAGLGMISFSDYFVSNRPDILVVLGDRFEIFAAATAAAMMRIPIAHICGGDTSEGAVDEFMRHSITKMSALHFPTNEESARRIIQMGESPEHVYNVGALHVENILGEKLMTREELSTDLALDLSGPYALVTYHPVTLSNGVLPTTPAAAPPTSGNLPSISDAAPPSSGKAQPNFGVATSSVDELKKLLDAIDMFPDITFIITKANADSGGRAINDVLDNYRGCSGNTRVFSSLGTRRYLSLMSRANAVIGNSSSGLYETPVFGVPAVNIGDRQKGRLCPDNVINCKPIFDDIVISVQKAISYEFTQHAKTVENPYGKGDTSRRILERIKEYQQSGRLALTKNFNWLK